MQGECLPCTHLCIIQKGMTAPSSSHAGCFNIAGQLTWLVFMEGASRVGGEGVMNLGQAYAKSSSKAFSPPRSIFCIFSLCLHCQTLTHNPSISQTRALSGETQQASNFTMNSPRPFNPGMGPESTGARKVVAFFSSS